MNILAYIDVAILCVLGGWMIFRRYTDVFRANKQRDELRVKADFMSAIVEDCRDGIVVQDMRARIIWANSSWCKTFGFELEEILGRNPLSFVIPKRNRLTNAEIEAFRYDLSTGFQNENEIVRNVRKDGSELWTSLSFTYHRLESGKDRIVVTCRDVTEDVEREEKLKQTNEIIAFRADHDALTGVANREKMSRVFEETRQAACAQNRTFGLMHIDLDHFKSVNDTFGHAAGDAVIIKAADRMRGLIGRNDLLARIGGDEFVIICPDRGNFSELKALAKQLIDSVSQPINWEDRDLRIGASIGVAVSSCDKNDQVTMLQMADVALYEAKKHGRNRVFCYDQEMNRSQLDKTRLGTELVEALEKDKLEVFLQPQYSLISKSVTGFEALIRWQHPQKGLLLPRDFLDVATEIGVIDEIDRFAAAQAFAAIKALDEAGHTGLHISVNISPLSLAQNEYCDFIKWEADKNDLDFKRISVEILESTFLSDREDKAMQTIQLLSETGFRVELDDFGTGYAGLAHLGRLKVDGVKIDKDMVQGLDGNVTNQIIVQAIVGLCRDLGLQIIAEGVVDPADAALLRQFGCINVQGSGISKPMPVGDVANWLETTDIPSLLSDASNPSPHQRAATS